MSASSSPSDDAPTFDPRTRLGECIADKWTLEEVLGRGGMAVVYAASHRNGHRVAIKMLLPKIAGDEALVRRFLREGYFANKVPHDGAVRVLDDGRAADGCPFLVMERLDGYTLDAHLDNTKPPLDVRASIDLMLELLAILAAAHRVSMVHRDVKPANIFRTNQGELKLLDFGIALLVETDPLSSVTQTGAIIGTPAFMAPEQARGRKELVGPRSDLWAVAASGLSLMIGRRLRDATTGAEELAMAALQPLPPVRTFGEALRGPLGDVLDRALAFEPRDRFASAEEMREALLPCRLDAPTLLLGASPALTHPLSSRTLPMHDVPAPRARDASAIHAVARPASLPAAATTSRLWPVALLALGAAAALALGVALVTRKDAPSKEAPAANVSIAATTAPAMTSAPPAATAPPASVSAPASVAPAPVASVAPTTRGRGGAGRPATAMPGRPSAQASAAQPTSAATPKPDFMDQR